MPRSLAARYTILQKVLECARNAFFVKDTKGVYIYVNGKASKYHFGLPKEEVLGKKDKDLFDPEKVKRIRRNDLKVIKTHTALVTEEESEIDGIMRCFKITKTPLIDGRGRVEGIIGVSEEITQSMQVEKEKRRLAGIVESTQDAIYSLSIDALVTSWNKAAEKLFGYTKEEVIEQPIEEFLIPPETQGESHRIMERLLNGEKIPPYTAQRIHRNGARLSVRVSMSPLKKTDGSVEGFSIIARQVPREYVQEARLVV